MADESLPFPTPARQRREANPNWGGGRSIASNGYVLIRVGTEHHLSDVRGYAYEHRLVAEKMIGRKLKPGEIVHHLNGVKTDNRQENLEVVSGIAEHLNKHRNRKDLRPYGGVNPTVQCACGCGNTFLRYDTSNRPRYFISGHNIKCDKGRFIIRNGVSCEHKD